MKQDARFRKILLIHTAFIGDLILSTPLVREIKANFPDSSLSLLLTPQTAPCFARAAGSTRFCSTTNEANKKARQIQPIGHGPQAVSF
jgi:ADP-heptose:LPS heptosyltransferase